MANRAMYEEQMAQANSVPLMAAFFALSTITSENRLNYCIMTGQDKQSKQWGFWVLLLGADGKPLTSVFATTLPNAIWGALEDLKYIEPSANKET